jgi:septin 7
VSIQSISADIEENGVRLRLTVVDTPGFGDFVNNDESWRPIVDNIEQRFDAYLDAENKVNRMNIVDNRVHACVYFIQPTGHALKPLDIEVMRRLHTKVNLIPVIAKADTMTDEEILAFKSRVSSKPTEQLATLTLLDPRRYQAPRHPDLRGSSLRTRRR